MLMAAKPAENLDNSRMMWQVVCDIESSKFYAKEIPKMRP